VNYEPKIIGGIRYSDDTQIQFTNARGYPGVGGMQVAMEYLWVRVTTPALGAQRWKRCNERSFLYAQAVASIADTAYEAMKTLRGGIGMKVYIVSSGCVFDGGTNRHVALTEARAIELAEEIVRTEPFGSPWKRDASARATTLACEGQDGPRRVAFWSDGYDFVAVHEWEVAT
jgi:hypothetical protein